MDVRISWVGDLSDADLALGRSLLPAGYSLDRVHLLGDEVEEADRAWLRTSQAVVSRRARVDLHLLQLCPRLELVQVYGVRDELVDRSAAAQARVEVQTTHLMGCVAVAELAIALMLCLSKRIIEGHQKVAGRAYRALGLEPCATTQSKHAFQWMRLRDVFELSGRTLGIVGFGEIGSEVAQRAHAFGMRVLYFKRVRLAASEEARLGIEWGSFEGLLQAADFVVLSLPYSNEVRHMIGRRQLAMMKPTSYLVNVARGPLVDESALGDALSAGRIAGAGLDVFEFEPWPGQGDVISHPRTVLTPHIGGGSGGAREKQLADVLAEVVEFAAKRRGSDTAGSER